MAELRSVGAQQSCGTKPNQSGGNGQVSSPTANDDGHLAHLLSRAVDVLGD